MRILVMQTTRMGDVLQTTPLLRGIRLRYPDAHIALMVRRMGKTIAERNPDVDEVIVYDEDAMFLDLRSLDSHRLLKAYRTAEEFIEKLREAHYDTVYNCTHSISSAMLLRMLQIPEVFGADLGDAGQFVLRGQWTNYFFTSVFHRDYNDLNLCDISRRFVEDAPPDAGLVFDLREEDRAFVGELLARHNVAPGDFVACLQLGASEDNKRWAAANFASLARLLAAKYNAKMFLLGVAEEAPLGEAFNANAPGLAVPLYGQTNIPQVAALLERANLLVTNDTGTMHIAAAVKCPVALISVGYVHFRETGPFGEGHCAIERRRQYVGRADSEVGGAEERAIVRPEQVLAAIELLFKTQGKDNFVQQPLALDLSDVDIYITRFAPDGCLQWYPALRRALSETDLLRIAYRAMWLDHLGALRSRDSETRSIQLMMQYWDCGDDGELSGRVRDLSTAFRGLVRLAERGVAETRNLITILRNDKPKKAHEIVQGLMSLDEEIRIYGEVNAACKPLVLIARYERDNLEGSDPIRLAQTTAGIYKSCLTRANLLIDKLKKIQSLA
jgi:ADP-heptose:LPS heptosyltransferase